MDPSRFDHVAKRFAARHSRRGTLKGSALAAAALAAQALPAAAQEATPAARRSSPVPADSGKVPFLFVQSFESGSLAPAPAVTPVTGTPTPQGADYTLTLSHGLGQTLFFSDRPERVVGALPTRTFLDRLGFSPANPPNAALVADLGNGDEEIVVVELLDPTYDEASRTATYGVRILEDDERVDMEFVRDPHAGGTRPAEEYGASHLFIDDCADASFCCKDSNGANMGTITEGTCWEWGSFGCVACRDYGPVCDAAFPACNGACEASGAGVNPWNGSPLCGT